MDGKRTIKTFVECSVLRGCVNTQEQENACSKLQRNYTLFAAKFCVQIVRHDPHSTFI